MHTELFSVGTCKANEKWRSLGDRRNSRKLNFLPLHFNPPKGYDLGKKVYPFSRVLTSRGNGWPVVAELLGASETLPSIFAHQQSIQEEQEMSPLTFPGGAGVKFCCLLQSKHLLFVKPSLHNQTRHLSKEKKKSFLGNFTSALPAGTWRKREVVKAQGTTSTGNPKFTLPH